jgi:hypothetical protein
MDNIGRQLIWNRIREKMEKGEEIGAGDFVWGILLNGGLSTKEAFLGSESVEIIKTALKIHEDIISKKDNELKALYEEKKAEHIKELAESKEFFKKFQARCKEIKIKINKSKIDSAIKDAVINTMTDYLGMLNREIIALGEFQDFNEWKKDIINVSSNQIGYLKQRIKKTQNEIMKNTKTWDKTEKAFQIPEHLKEKDDGIEKKV